MKGPFVKRPALCPRCNRPGVAWVPERAKRTPGGLTIWTCQKCWKKDERRARDEAGYLPGQPVFPGWEEYVK